MRQTSDFQKMKWISRPPLYLMDKTQLVMETCPFSGINGKGLDNPCEAGIETKGNFSFTVCLQHIFMHTFDECGIILYNNARRIMMTGIRAHDDMTNQMHCIVFHQKQGDISMRNIGTGLEKNYFRIMYRSNYVKVQYSFNGDIFSDMRKFWVEDPQRMHISLYACSPLNSSFDAVFTKMLLEEGE